MYRTCAALHAAVQQTKEVGDEEDDQNLRDLIIDVHQVLLITLISQCLEVPANDTGDP